MQTVELSCGIHIATHSPGSRDGCPIRLRHSGFTGTSNDHVLVRAKPTGRSPMGHESRVPNGWVAGGAS